jgi:glycosyltransferase involved in cell wall biosynthesis
VKIAFYNLTTTTKSGGIETFNREMAKALSKRGHIIHIYGGKSDFVSEDAGVPVYTYPFIRRELFPNFGTRFRRFMERLSFAFFALRDLIGRDYDYIYLIKPYDIPAALALSVFSKTKIIFGSSGTEFFCGYRHLAKRVDHFFACSEFNAAQIERYCGIRPAVLYNGVDTNLFRPMDPDGELQRTLKLSNHDKVVITVGRLVGLKGIKFAIMAVETLLKKGHALKYIIIGDGEERISLEELVNTLRLKEHVFFLGNIPNSLLPKYYSLAGQAVFASIAEEAFGISVVEAMACGVPTVSTMVGAIPEVVGDAGLLVPPGDVDAIASSMEVLISNSDLRTDLAIRGKKRIEDKFTWNLIAEDFERLVTQP